jgi:hypothetical protein
MAYLCWPLHSWATLSNDRDVFFALVAIPGGHANPAAGDRVAPRFGARPGVQSEWRAENRFALFLNPL